MIRHSISLTGIIAPCKDLQVCLNVQSATPFRFERVNVVDMMNDAGELSQPLGLPIKFEDFIVVSPTWRRLQNCCAVSSVFSVLCRSVVPAPNRVPTIGILAIIFCIVAAPLKMAIPVLGKPLVHPGLVSVLKLVDRSLSRLRYFFSIIRSVLLSAFSNGLPIFAVVTTNSILDRRGVFGVIRFFPYRDARSAVSIKAGPGILVFGKFGRSLGLRTSLTEF
jgi:hypothetical protein